MDEGADALDIEEAAQRHRTRFMQACSDACLG
jgi:hypothetical protein